PVFAPEGYCGKAHLAAAPFRRAPDQREGRRPIVPYACGATGSPNCSRRSPRCEGRTGMSVDTRTRPISATGPTDPETFFGGEWREAVGRHGARAAEDAARLGLPSLTITVDGAAWTLQPRSTGIDVARGTADARLSVALDSTAFADLFCERRTALGLGIGGRVEGDAPSMDAFCAWD